MKNPEQVASRSEFPLFKELPYEVRSMIWKQAAQEKRIISIFEDSRSFRDYRHDDPRRSRDFHDEPIATHNATTPTIMHASHESRLIGLNFYKAQLEATFFGTPIYLNYEQDVLHFESNSDVEAFYALFWEGNQDSQNEINELKHNHKTFIVGARTGSLGRLHIPADFWRVKGTHGDWDERLQNRIDDFIVDPLDPNGFNGPKVHYLIHSEGGETPTIRQLKSLTVDELDLT